VSEMLSYCGLFCNTCPIYMATMETNREEQNRKRTEIARLCKEQYGMNYEIADITDCDGCRAEGGRIFSGCKDCGIRSCAKEKMIENCAHCMDYSCEKLKSFFIKDQVAKTRLDEVRSRVS
jgi:hypothetical protein